MTDLGTLGGDRSDAFAINEAGQIVGVSTIVPGQNVPELEDGWRAFLWQDGRMEALGTAEARSTGAWGINDRGEVVGEAVEVVADAGEPDALLWRGEQATDLADLIPPESGWDRLRIARAINARGQIVGWGQRDGATRAFLLTPRSAHATPIPGAPVPSVSIEPPLRFADTV